MAFPVHKTVAGFMSDLAVPCAPDSDQRSNRLGSCVEELLAYGLQLMGKISGLLGVPSARVLHVGLCFSAAVEISGYREAGNPWVFALSPEARALNSDA